MRTLFLRIFLSFWLATGLAVSVLAISIWWIDTSQLEERTRAVGRELISLHGRVAVDVLERWGVAELEDYLERAESGTQIRAFLFDDAGRSVLERPIPPGAGRVAERALESERLVECSEYARALVGKRFFDSAGTPRVLVLELPLGPVTLLQRGLPGQLGALLLVVLVVGVVCYLLAWRLTAPIRDLRRATRLLAAGDLGARTSAPSLGSGDEVGELQRDFNRMAERISSLIEAQGRLLGDVSHELRSPLARLGVALGLAEQRAGPAARSALAVIEREIECLDGLVGRLLTLHRAESDEAAVAFEELDLAAMIGRIISNNSLECAARNRSFRLVDCENCTIRGNEELLHSAIENVVRNASRHTAEDSAVEISLSRYREGGGEGARVLVRDHGPGVPEEELTRIFDPFYRVAESRERASGGAGLGLSIAQRAIELHSGTVRAENAPGGGLRVEILLPRNC